MLEAIFDVLTSIGDFFASVGGFLVSLVEDIVSVVKLTGKAVLSIPNYIGFLPATLISGLIIVFSVVVLYKVLGRD